MPSATVRRLPPRVGGFLTCSDGFRHGSAASARVRTVSATVRRLPHAFGRLPPRFGGFRTCSDGFRTCPATAAPWRKRLSPNFFERWNRTLFQGVLPVGSQSFIALPSAANGYG